MSPGKLEPIVLYTRAWRSGTGLYAQGLAQGIAAAGYPLTFISPDGQPDDPASRLPNVTRIKPPRELVAAGSKLARVAASLKRVVVALSALLLARRVSRHFITTIPDPFVFSLAPLLLLRLTGAQVVFVCHDPSPHAWILPPGLRWLERGGHAAMYRIASKIVVLAQAGQRALVRDFDVPADKIAVIPHGAFDLPDVGPLSGSRMLLVLGTIRRNKQVDLAMRGFAATRRAGRPSSLVVAGGPDPSDLAYLDECQAIAAQIGPEVSIRPQYLSDSEMLDLVKASDALVLPYGDFDSQSGVAIYAGMAGRPVIATAAGGIADLIAAGLAAVEIQPPADATAVAAAIEQFYASDPQTWSQRAASGRQSLTAALDWTAIGGQFGRLFTA